MLLSLFANRAPRGLHYLPIFLNSNIGEFHPEFVSIPHFFLQYLNSKISLPYIDQKISFLPKSANVIFFCYHSAKKKLKKSHLPTPWGTTAVSLTRISGVLTRFECIYEKVKRFVYQIPLFCCFFTFFYIFIANSGFYTTFDSILYAFFCVFFSSFLILTIFSLFCIFPHFFPILPRFFYRMRWFCENFDSILYAFFYASSVFVFLSRK